MPKYLMALKQTITVSTNGQIWKQETSFGINKSVKNYALNIGNIFQHYQMWKQKYYLKYITFQEKYVYAIAKENYLLV